VTEATACKQDIYLEVPTLVSGGKYTLEAPHGEKAFAFDDHSTSRESLNSRRFFTFWKIL